MVTTTYIQSKTIIAMLFLFLKHHRAPNKFWIFVGHGNVKDRLSVKRIGLQVPTIFTKPTEAKFSFTSCCEDFNLQVIGDCFCSTRMPTANVAGGGWLETDLCPQVLQVFSDPGQAVQCMQRHHSCPSVFPQCCMNSLGQKNLLKLSLLMRTMSHEMQ